jgi:hypothetical protein
LLITSVTRHQWHDIILFFIAAPLAEPETGKVGQVPCKADYLRPLTRQDTVFRIPEEISVNRF